MRDKRILLYLLLIFISISGNAQGGGVKDIATILQEAIEHEQFSSFLCREANDSILLSVIMSNNRIPKSVRPRIFNRNIPVVGGKADSTYPFAVIIEKIKLKPTKAFIKFSYNQGVKAAFNLFYEQENWWVSRVSIHQNRNCQGIKNGRKFRFSF